VKNLQKVAGPNTALADGDERADEGTDHLVAKGVRLDGKDPQAVVTYSKRPARL
jgi:hypothetical protein